MMPCLPDGLCLERARETRSVEFDGRDVIPFDSQDFRGFCNVMRILGDMGVICGYVPCLLNGKVENVLDGRDE
ncbi:MAG: hypothetical protein LBF26_02245 [Puniceicoccales bacterium]|jgi:hypothetical protein|nr:hypothetical protein [Puniceicoccales bacterium]